jgi:hypothetical protein
MTPPKTIYVPDKMVPTWDRMEELIGSASVASHVNGLVADWVADQERLEAAKAGGMGPIVVEREDRDGRVTKYRFQGKWLVKPDADETRSGMAGQDAGIFWGVALGANGGVVVTYEHCNRGEAGFTVYDDFESAEMPDDVRSWAAEELGMDHVIDIVV